MIKTKARRLTTQLQHKSTSKSQRGFALYYHKQLNTKTSIPKRGTQPWRDAVN